MNKKNVVCLTCFKDLVGQPAEAIKLNDSKLPIGWEKRAKLKTSGTKAGKWDVVIVG